MMLPMSKLATTDPNELRPILHERIDQCTLEELEGRAEDAATPCRPAANNAPAAMNEV